ncbi:hypothetical protein B566_EDAN011207 [Ephemera danica]|nr:hypothetical protein B566_EDAN011207 [Ephemera danica]
MASWDPGCDCTLAIIGPCTIQPMFPGPRWLPVVGCAPQFRNLSRELGYQHLALSYLSRLYDSPVIGLKLGGQVAVAVTGYEAVHHVLTSEEFEGRPDNFFIRLRSMGTRKGITCTDGGHWQEQRSFAVRHLKRCDCTLAIIGPCTIQPMFPGPRWLPVVGCAPQFRNLSRELGYQHLALSYLSRLYDSPVIGLKLGGQVAVAVTGYEAVHHVLTSEEFEGRPDNFFIRLRSMGTRKGITCTDGGHWQEQRSFATDEPICPDLAPSVMSVLWALIAGTQFSEDDPALARLLDLMHKRARAFDMSGGVLSQFPWIRHFAPDASGYTLLRTVNQELHAFFMGGIDEQLVMVCLDMFVAGSTTTSNSLSFALLYLSCYPKVQIKIQQELDEVLGAEQLPTLADQIRFLDPTGKCMQDEWLMPFGLGRRRCLGEALARGCMFLFLASILHRFHIESSDIAPPPPPIPGITLSPPKYEIILHQRF